MANLQEELAELIRRTSNSTVPDPVKPTTELKTNVHTVTPTKVVKQVNEPKVNVKPVPKKENPPAAHVETESNKENSKQISPKKKSSNLKVLGIVVLVFLFFILLYKMWSKRKGKLTPQPKPNLPKPTFTQYDFPSSGERKKLENKDLKHCKKIKEDKSDDDEEEEEKELKRKEKEKKKSNKKNKEE